MQAMRIPFRSGPGLSAESGPPPRPGRPVAVLAHGAGDTLRHPLLRHLADRLGAAGIGSLRFNFPWVEEGRATPNTEPVLLEAWRAVFAAAERLYPGAPLFAGGKSLGGRSATLLAARGLPAVCRGVFCLGFPLHAPGCLGLERARHLAAVRLPLLLLQGTRDASANPGLLSTLVSGLPRAELHLVEGADHAFRVPGHAAARHAAWEALASVLAGWMERVAGA